MVRYNLSWFHLQQNCLDALGEFLEVTLTLMSRSKDLLRLSSDVYDDTSENDIIIV